MSRALAALLVGVAATLAACGQTPKSPTTSLSSAGGEVDFRNGGYYKVGDPYQINGVWYYPAENYNYAETGIASYYGGETQGVNFHGRQTANGEVYDMNALTAAHQTLPMPSLVRVTNLDNGRQMVLRVNDRGPFVRGRIIDVSRRSAQLLGFEQIGTAKVRVEVLPEESRAIKIAMLGGPVAPSVLVAAANPRQPVISDAVAAAPPPPPVPAPAPISRPDVVATAIAPPPSLQPAPVQPSYAPPPPPAYSPPSAPQPMIVLTPPPSMRPPSAGGLPPAPASRPTLTPPPAAAGPQLAQNGLPLPPQLRPPVSREVAALPVEQQVRLTPVVRQTRVTQSNIFISAGAYTNYDQATRISTRLSRVSASKVQTVRFGGQQLFRVMVGPLASVPEADQVFDQVTAIVPDAKLIVE